MNVEILFHEALAKSNPRERAAYLDQVCDGNTELRARVEALLAAHAGDDSFLDLSAVPPDVTGVFIPTPPESPLTGHDRPATACFQRTGAPGLVIADLLSTYVPYQIL